MNDNLGRRKKLEEIMQAFAQIKKVENAEYSHQTFNESSPDFDRPWNVEFALVKARNSSVNDRDDAIEEIISELLKRGNFNEAITICCNEMVYESRKVKSLWDIFCFLYNREKHTDAANALAIAMKHINQMDDWMYRKIAINKAVLDLSRMGESESALNYASLIFSDEGRCDLLLRNSYILIEEGHLVSVSSLINEIIGVLHKIENSETIEMIDKFISDNEQKG